MAQKLDADLNIVQNSGVEIQIDPLTKDLNIIQALDDEPNDVGGMSAQELKEAFDRAGNLIKEYINDSLIPQVLGADATEQQRAAAETQRQANEAARQSAEAQRQENETARGQAAAQLNQQLSDSVGQLEEDVQAAEAAREVWEDYNPAKTYVPGNKVYYLGSSYVNTLGCTDVLPTVAANWQMIAKKGADSDEGMSQEEADLRYLRLAGGILTGPVKVQSPTEDANPATKGYVEEYALPKLEGEAGKFLSFDADGNLVQKTVTNANHMVIFEESGVFDPSEYGLGPGDVVSVVLIGGGEGGYPGNPYSGSGGSPAGNGLDAGAPNANSYDISGEPGKGYGAGGGGGYGGNSSGGTGGSGGKGGTSGEVVWITVEIGPDNSPISVTVGTGGTGGTVTPWSFPSGGGASSFGNYATARGGNSQGSVPVGRFPGGQGGAAGKRGADGFGEWGGLGASPRATSNTSSGAGGGGGGGFQLQESGIGSGPITTVQKGSGAVIVTW